MPSFLTAPDLAACEKVQHGFFTRQGGCSDGIYSSLNCGLGSRDEPANVQRNRTRICTELGGASTALAGVHQVHGSRVHTVRDLAQAQSRPEADGLVTRVPGIILSVLSADCAPILFVDPQAGVIGAAHAGWRGALSGIGEATVEAMCALGAERVRIRAAIGPCISQAAYEVSADMQDEFLARDPVSREHFAPGCAPDKYQFALGPYVASRLARAGIVSVHRMEVCTYGDDARCFSYRRATHRGEPDYGRAISAIMLSPDEGG